MRWMDGISVSVDMSLSKLRKTVKDREVWHAAFLGIVKSRTQLRDLTTTNFLKGIKQLGILVFRGDWSTYNHADNF